jgi:glutamate--cysteine ligase catalytic subunit
VQVDENMHRAQKRNAAREETFFFRKWVFPLGKTPSHVDCRSRSTSPNGFKTTNESYENGSSVPHSASTASFKLDDRSGCPSPAASHFEPDDEVEEMTLDELFNGKVCSLLCSAA